MGTPSGGSSNAAHHLDAVPTSTPVHIVPKHKKKIRSYPMFLNSYVDKNVTDNANQEEVLVPIRIDMELEGIFIRALTGLDPHRLFRL